MWRLTGTVGQLHDRFEFLDASSLWMLPVFDTACTDVTTADILLTAASKYKEMRQKELIASQVLQDEDLMLELVFSSTGFELGSLLLFT